MSWHDYPVLSIDTETTGTDPFTARIVEVAAVLVHPSGEAMTIGRMIVDPGVDIPEAASDVHGITTERARAEGSPPVDALIWLGAEIEHHQNATRGRGHVAMFNVRYDWPLILNEAARHGVETPSSVPLVCPMLLDRMYDRFRKGSRKLVDAADHYGVELSGEAHGAVVDATAAGQILWKLADAFPELRKLTAAGLLLAQVRGYEEWRSGFEDYLRRQRDPQASIPAGWPVPCGQEAR